MTEIVAKVFGIKLLDEKPLVIISFYSVSGCLQFNFLTGKILRITCKSSSSKIQESLAKKSTALGIFFD